MKHKAWNNDAGITHTPTFFINGRKIHSRYKIEVIEKIVSQLTDAFVVV
jgi:protein-disulfide isomerase